MENSPFARLPAELRNHIWQAVLNQLEPVDARLVKDYYFARAPARQTWAEEKYLALAQTCSQIRSETRELFYTVNTFRITTEDLISGGSITRSSWTSPEIAARCNELLTPLRAFAASCEHVDVRHTRSIIVQLGQRAIYPNLIGDQHFVLYDLLQKLLQQVKAFARNYEGVVVMVALQLRTRFFYVALNQEFEVRVDLRRFEQCFEELDRFLEKAALQLQRKGYGWGHQQLAADMRNAIGLMVAAARSGEGEDATIASGGMKLGS